MSRPSFRIKRFYCFPFRNLHINQRNKIPLRDNLNHYQLSHDYCTRNKQLLFIILRSEELNSFTLVLIPFLHLRNNFFFYLGFLSRKFAIHKAGEGEGYLFNFFLPPPPTSQTLDISRAITTESSPLHIVSKRGSNWEILISERKSLTTKLRALWNCNTNPYLLSSLCPKKETMLLSFLLIFDHYPIHSFK